MRIPKSNQSWNSTFWNPIVPCHSYCSSRSGNVWCLEVCRYQRGTNKLGVIRRKIDNTMAQEKVQKDKQWLT